MRPAIRAIAAGRTTSASILQGSSSFAAAAGAAASATIIPAPVPGSRPTYYNTGPTGGLTQQSPSTINPYGGTYSNIQFTGSWEPWSGVYGSGPPPDSTVWNFTNCQFDGDVRFNFVGPLGWPDAYVSNNPATCNMTNCSMPYLQITGSLQGVFNRIRALSDLYIQITPEVYTWKYAPVPIAVINSFFWKTMGVARPNPADNDHTETWFQFGYPDGLYFYNNTFVHEGGYNNGTCTGVTNIHFGGGGYGVSGGFINPFSGMTNTIEGCYFDWGWSPTNPTGSTAPTNNNIYAEDGTLRFINNKIAARGCNYLIGSAWQPNRGSYTFSGNRDLDTGNLLVYNGDTLVDTGSP